MAQPVSPKLDVELLQSDLQAQLDDQPVSIIYLESCESTNSECMQRASHASVVIAEHQTAGRGRRGKNWHSPLSQNIYCSIGVNKSIQADFLGLISLQVGVSIAEVLHAQGYTGVSLKWPNDILLQGKKLGGILIETRVNTSDDFFLVIGFGLNVHLDDSAMFEIDQPAISLTQVSGNALDLQQLFSELIGGILKSVISFEIPALETLLQQFARFDSFQGKQVQVKTLHETISGFYQGIQSTGQLRIKTEHGLMTFSAAEISLREL